MTAPPSTSTHRPAPLRALVALLLIGAMVATACVSGADLSSVTSVELPTSSTVDGSTTAAAGATTAGAETVAVSMPAIPPIVLPDVSVLSETGDRVSDRLGNLTAPASGVDVVAASCDEADGLVYQGSTGDNVFDIDADGSGIYQQERDDGLLTIQIDPDGSGLFIDESPSELITITVDPEGAGVYFQGRNRDTPTLTVTVDGAGTGEYWSADGTELLTVTLTPDGTGEYVSSTDERYLTVRADDDGSGQYTWAAPGGLDQRRDREVTVTGDAEGSWRLEDKDLDRRIVVEVEADGSGLYRRSGLDPLEIAFGPDGTGLGGRVLLPPGPTFVVTARFPSLGQLGALTPPCATVIRFDDALLFDVGRAELRPEADEVLDGVVAALAETDLPIEINGHTDSTGTDEYNLDLSRRRAEAVEAALRDRGLTVEMEINGYGETQPVAPNTTADGSPDPAGQAQNRRVEIVIRESTVAGSTSDGA